MTIWKGEIKMEFRDDFSEGRVYAICDEEGHATDWRILLLHDKVEAMYESWFYNNAFGVMTYLFGTPSIDSIRKGKNFIEFCKMSLKYVEANYILLTEDYRKEYMD